MSIIWFLIVGAIAGWIAGELTKGSGYGLLGNIVVGVVGALIGGYLFSVFGIDVYGLLGEIIMAVIGAVVFLFILSLFRRGPVRP